MIGCAFINVGLLIAAGAYYFFLEKKVAKIQDSKNASFSAQAFAQQIVQNHGLNLDAPLRTRKSTLQHQANAPSAHRPPCSARFHPEALLLSEKQTCHG
ncbi:hypothetical protein HQ865_19855 [Mucilaginibacter mali]|uniref:Uncharacterized protein n=1 Tax=Mucilaginibacter mali TaxID=2740462 RepID=A0A7D4QE65_9SPHI|nr:hypothetical protein [Mucilaginibacter mali]QKJ31924.1 hypothetical protein HQ865_19855 [Mucilaginibacter mali]